MFRIALFCCFAAMAFGQSDVASDKGWFAGVSVGGSEFNPPDDEPQNDAINDHEDTFFGLQGGYRFNRYFSLEGGLLDLGEWTTTIDGTAVDMSASGHRLMAVGRIPLHHRFALLGKGGFFHHYLEEKPQGNNVDDKETRKLNFNLALELGLEIRATEKLWVTFGIHGFVLEDPKFIKTENNGEDEFKLENDAGTLGAASVGLSYRF